MRLLPALWASLCVVLCCPGLVSSTPRPLAYNQQAEGVGTHERSLQASKSQIRRRLLQDLDEGTIQTVYFNGLAPGWSGSESYGCDCDFDSSKPFFLLRESLVPGEKRSTPAELTAYTRVLPWAAVVLQNKQGFRPPMVLDFYAKGTGLTRSEFYLQNPELGYTSRKAQLSSNDVTDLPEDFLGVRDASSGSKGWMHLQMDLRKLTRGAERNWTTIVFRDVSGSGFTLQFALMRLAPVPEGFNVSSAESQQSLEGLRLDPRQEASSGAQPEVPILNLDTPRKKKAEISMASVDEEPPTKFVMKIKENVTKAQLEDICNVLRSRNGDCKPNFNDTADAAASSTDILNWKFQAFTVETMEDVLDMSEALGDTLEYIEKDLIATIAQAGISRVRSWGLDRIDQTSLPLDATFNPGHLNGANTHVYVLDTGASESHKDFEGRVGESRSVLGGNFIDDSNGHGTHVAGTVLGAFHGVARSSILHTVKVLDMAATGSYSDIIAGLEWVIDHVRRNNFSQAVVVMSHGGPKSWSLNDAVEETVKAGIMVVVAAGNDRGGDACSYSPSSTPSAIVVGASTQNDRLASFSNIGSCVTLFAPGKDIVSASDLEDNAEMILSGTSMAVSHVAGTVAMILEQQPGANVSTVKEMLRRAALRIQFEPTSPDLLLNAQSSRLVGSGSSLTTPPPFSPRPRPSWCDECFWCVFC